VRYVSCGRRLPSVVEYFVAFNVLLRLMYDMMFLVYISNPRSKSLLESLWLACPKIHKCCSGPADFNERALRNFVSTDILYLIRRIY